MNLPVFPFLAVMFAVLMGMGVVRLIMASAVLVRGDEKIKPYWLHGAWLFFMLLIYLHVWWSMWDFRQVESWNYFSYIFLLSGPVILFLATNILLPELQSGNDFNFKDFYFRINRKYFLTMTFAVIWGMLLFPVFLGKPDPILPYLLIFAGIMVILALFKNPRLHYILSIIAWILFLSWVISYGVSM